MSRASSAVRGRTRMTRDERPAAVRRRRARRGAIAAVTAAILLGLVPAVSAPAVASCATVDTFEETARRSDATLFVGRGLREVDNGWGVEVAVDRWFTGPRPARVLEFDGTVLLLTEPPAAGVVAAITAMTVAGDAIGVVRGEPVFFAAAGPTADGRYVPAICGIGAVPLASPEGQEYLRKAVALFGPGLRASDIPDTATALTDVPSVERRDLSGLPLLAFVVGILFALRRLGRQRGGSRGRSGLPGVGAAAVLLAVGAIVIGCGGTGASPAGAGTPPGTPMEGGTTPAPGEPSSEPAAEVAVACAAGAPALDADRVRTSADGVRFVVNGPAGWVLGVTTARGHESVELSASPALITLRVPPGDAGISCADPALPEIGPAAPLVVEDPDGWYRPAEPEPAGGDCVSMSATPAMGATGAKGDPVALARIALADLRPGDVVERGGYPVDTGTVRVVRDGVVVGRLTYVADGQGGWLLLSSTMCQGLRVAG